MFLDEARITVALQHPNIVQVYDLGAASGSYYIVMEYVDGTDLRRLITACAKAGTTIPYRHILLIVSEALKALKYAHTACGQDGRPLNLVHQDVSPANIMVSRLGTVQLTDFGVARAAIAKWKRDPSEILGKYRYFAPELVAGGTPSPRSDIFALAAVLYELVTGPPLLLGARFEDVFEELRRFDPEDALDRDLSIPAPLEPILLKALAAHPAVRYATASEFLDDLTDHIVEDRIRLSSSDLASFVSQLYGAVEGFGAEEEMGEGDPPSLTLEVLDNAQSLPGDSAAEDDEEDTDRRRWAWPQAPKAKVFTPESGFEVLDRRELRVRVFDGRLSMRTLVHFRGDRWRPVSSFLEGNSPGFHRSSELEIVPLQFRRALRSAWERPGRTTAIFHGATELVAIHLQRGKLLGLRMSKEKDGLLGAAERAGLLNHTQAMVLAHLAGLDDSRAVEAISARRLVPHPQLEVFLAKRLADAIERIYRWKQPLLRLSRDTGERGEASSGLDFDAMFAQVVRSHLGDAHLSSAFARHLDRPLRLASARSDRPPVALRKGESLLLEPAIDSMTLREILGKDWFDAPADAYRAIYLLLEFGMLKLEGQGHGRH